ncbi:MAG TPA: exopolysaccharide biosynthesis polyprenyl glycosylphosphotransferase [Rhodoblastus sp.]|nr:exopolysaccharide biosynthesis polyprenyl glycosylphosphotransferase [Rhodoblastus sp.]
MSDVALRDGAIYGEPGEKPCNSSPRRRLSLEKTVLVLLGADVLTLILCGWVAITLSASAGQPMAGPLDDLTVVVALSAPLYLLVATPFGVYRSQTILKGDRSLALLAALAATFLVLLVIGVATRTTHNYPRAWFFAWATFACSLAPLARLGLQAHVRRRLAQGDYVYRALSVGVFARPFSRADLDQASDGLARLAQVIELKSLDAVADLADWIARADIDRIYVVTPWDRAPLVLDRLRRLRDFSAEIFVVPDDANIRAHQLGVGTIRNRVALRAAQRPINGWDLIAKRLQDVTIAGAALVLFAPILLLVALAVRLDSRGPVLFRQKRVGFNGRAFEVLKFRSMFQDAADAGASRQTARNDARVTRVGRFIRRASLDELPQLINVLRGDMSIVGPRPHALATRANGLELRQITEQYAARHRVKPGITGLAQVNGYRGELDSAEKLIRRVDFDLAYIENWSSWLDFKIILRTALLLFHDPAAY